jgi:pimeloyl-ACP methyl ester carboxylesterase
MAGRAIVGRRAGAGAGAGADKRSKDAAPTRIIAFSHANGFPAGTYRLLFEAWQQAGYRVIAVERFGHDPAYPVSSRWPHLRNELIDLVDRQANGERVHLVGHSMGGYVNLLAACKRPDLAQSLVLIDSPLVTGWRAHTLHMMKLSGLAKRLSPGRVSERRRWQWPSAEAAWQHFAAKSAFARWDPAVLRDYVASGTEADPDAPSPGAVRLAFRREIETRIYITLPHHLGSLLARHPPQCKASYVGGTRSSEGRQAGMAATRALVRERVQWIEGSHLFPMEKPLETAAAVLAAIQHQSA